VFTSELITKALEEDIGAGDLTASALLEIGQKGSASIVAKQDLVVAGLGVAGAVFTALDPHVTLAQMCEEGAFARKGQTLMRLQGRLQSLLMAERTALNFLQRLCGIATLTSQFVSCVKGVRTKILDTRKTTPLLRHLEKYAVRMGGGTNHRMGLFDEMMIKDNHIAALGGDIVLAIQRARQAYPSRVLVVEVTTLQQLRSISELSFDRVLLDNMSNAQIQEALDLVRQRFPIEVSGGITLDRVKALSEMGVDYISVGALTHSAAAADLSLEFETYA